MVNKPVRKTHRTRISKRRTQDVRSLADAAMADVASVTTTLALLIEAEPRLRLEPESRTQLQDGIRSKIATAIISLQAIDAALGGAQ